jgi:3-isopropylmalate/(R)-2-methylmalate dehydratase large subunit
MNIIEKILAKKSNLTKVEVGQIIEVDVDYSMANDATMLLNMDIFKNKLCAQKVWDSSKVVIIVDHQVPADSVNTARVHKLTKEFAQSLGIEKLHMSDGVCHQLMLEKYVLPGQLVVGADSHTCSYGAIGAFSTGMGSTDIAYSWATGKVWLKVPPTVKINMIGTKKEGVTAKDIILYIIGKISVEGASYKCVEFSGEGVYDLEVHERITLCNMLVEAGAKAGMIYPDKKVVEYLKDERGYEFELESVEWMKPDNDAEYCFELSVDLFDIEPQVAFPHNVDNTKNISEVEDIYIDQAFIGACTNGRIEDLREAADILRDKKVHKNVRLLVTPASVKIYKKAMEEGLIEIFLNAGAIVNHPGCSTCWGACQGVLCEGERLITTANRNFKGRAGSPESFVYLASPKVVAASAIAGKIVDHRGGAL